MHEFGELGGSKMNNLDLYRKRLEDSQKILKSTLIKNKVKTFNRALLRSYNSEEVEKNGQRFQALVTGIPTTPKIGKKFFATLLDNNCETGDEIFWGRANSHWIITEHDETEAAVFQGTIEKALYNLSWRDPITGEIYFARACAKGPDETTISDGVKHSIFFDEFTDSLYLIVSSKNKGTELLDDYFEIMVDGSKWRIEVVDNKTRENLLYIQLMERPIDRDKDTEDLVDGKERIEINMHSSLTTINKIELGSTLDFKPFLTRNGSILDRGEMEINVTNCSYLNNELTFDKLGIASITVEFKDYDLFFEEEVEVVENNNKTIEVKELVGAELVKTFATATYSFVHRINGVDQSVNGDWEYDDTFFDLVLKDNNTLELRVKNKTGNTKIIYRDFGVTETIDIKVIPMFGGS